MRDDGAELLHERRRLGLVLDLVADDRELVAPDARDRVARPHGAAQAAPDGDQQQIAGEVAERVVHELEAIDVDDADGDQTPRAPRPADGRAQAVEQARAVGQAGEAVVQCLVPQGVLGLPLLGHVVERQHRPVQRAVVAEDRLSPGAPVTQLAVGAQHRVLHRVHDLAAQQPCNRGVAGLERRDAVGADPHAAAEPLVGALPRSRTAVVALEDAIPEHDRALGVGGDDARVGMVDDRSQEGEIAVAVGGRTATHPTPYRHAPPAT